LSGAEILEARDRPVGVADVEELVALDVVAAGQQDRDEGILERTAVARGP